MHLLCKSYACALQKQTDGWSPNVKANNNNQGEVIDSSLGKAACGTLML